MSHESCSLRRERKDEVLDVWNLQASMHSDRAMSQCRKHKLRQCTYLNGENDYGEEIKDDASSI